MSLHYEAPPPPRFLVEQVDGREQIRIPPQRSIFLSLFLTVWLCGWTVGGMAAIGALLTKDFQPFLAFWLCGWAIGETLVAATLCWLWTGAEYIRVVNSDLEVGYRMLGYSRRKLYQGSQIRNLAPQGNVWFATNNTALPIAFANRTGSVKFAYGGRTIYLAAGLDEAEGRLIVDRLLKHLPKTASAG